MTLRVLDGIEAPAMPFLGDGMAAAMGRVADHAALLLPAECPGVGRMAPRRLKEYSSGRRVAREALRELGLPGRPVPRRGRAPAWPSGVVGGIAHSRELALAVVARRERLAGVGADLEPEGRVGERVAQRTLSAGERAGLPDADWRTMLFSAKEAVYKAVNPIVGEYLAFADVALTPSMDGTFLAATTRPCASTDRVAAGEGAFLRVAGHWLTVFLVPAA